MANRKKPKRKPAGSKTGTKKTSRVAVAKFHGFKPPRADREWELLLGREAFGVERAKRWATARVRSAGATALTVVGGPIPAQFGVAWVDNTAKVFYHVLVNGLDIGEPHEAFGGTLVRDIGLERGENRLHWAIGHTLQGWKNAVFLKVNGQVFRLSEDADPSTSTNDDTSSKTVVFTI